MKSLYLFLIWNVIVFFAYGIDKLKAKRGAWRISEATLVLFAWLMGAFGAVLGMVVFNHKTSKPKFRYLVPLAFLLNCAVIYHYSEIFQRIVVFFSILS